MNQYKKYMDRQGVSPSLHARLTALAEGDGPAPAGRAPHRYRWGILAACCVLAAGLAWAGGVRQPDGAAQAYSMDSAGMQSAQSGAAHQGSSEAVSYTHLDVYKRQALPQVGVSQADVIYEILAEGGITRMMAVFQDVAGAGEIGTVRSARDYYASLAYGHDAVYLHAGGSPQAYEFIKSRGVTALDCVNGPYEGTLFWRDQERRRSAGLEHSVLTSSETIQELLPTYQRVRLDHEEGFQVGWTFQELSLIHI